jgi:hypothetical protein
LSVRLEETVSRVSDKSFSELRSGVSIVVKSSGRGQ